MARARGAPRRVKTSKTSGSSRASCSSSLLLLPLSSIMPMSTICDAVNSLPICSLVKCLRRMMVSCMLCSSLE